MIIAKSLLLTLLAFFVCQTSVSANDNIEVDLLSNVSVSKDDILKSLDMLKKQGQISETDYEKAKKELLAMSDSQVNNIKDKAVEIVKKDPNKAIDLVNSKKIEKPAIPDAASKK